MLCLSAKRFSFMKSKPRPLPQGGGPQNARSPFGAKGCSETNSSQIFIPSFIANETLLNLVKTRGVILSALLGGFDWPEKGGWVSISKAT